MEEGFKIYKEVIEYNGVQYEVHKKQLDQYKTWYKLWSEGDLDIIRAMKSRIRDYINTFIPNDIKNINKSIASWQQRICMERNYIPDFVCNKTFDNYTPNEYCKLSNHVVDEALLEINKKHNKNARKYNNLHLTSDSIVIQARENINKLEQQKQFNKNYRYILIQFHKQLRRYVYQEEMKIWLEQKQKEMNGFIAETVKNKKVNNDNDIVEGVF